MSELVKLYTALNKSQEILNEYIMPESNVDPEDTINNLLSVLDNEQLASVMRQVEESMEHPIKTKHWPSSGNVNSTMYYGPQQVLEIEFKNGSIYQYKEVPTQVWEKLIKAESIGSFVHSEIIGLFEYEKVNGLADQQLK